MSAHVSSLGTPGARLSEVFHRAGGVPSATADLGGKR
jgi:hypothetical protein